MGQSFNTNISFIQPKDARDALSMREKAEMMKIAVNHGITNLQDIRQRYNEFAMGGDAEDTEPLSLNEAKRMGVMVGASLFKQPKAYIGGTPSEARDKYWQQDNEMRILTDSVASRYNLNPDLLRSRMDSEGYTDSRIAENNIDVKTGSNKALTGEALFHSQTLPVDAIHEFGFDDVATYINNGTVSLINENWGDGQFENEKGRTTHAASGHNYSDNIGIMAATLRGLREVARKDFPNASEADLDRYAQAYYNRGITGGREWVKRGAKGYKVTKHSLGGPLVDAAMNEYKNGGGIHIKHPGRLTALKKRTGKNEAQLWAEGRPEVRKMITFARNSRKWKHSFGGPLVENLFDDGGGANIFRRPDGTYFYQETPESTEVTVTPISTAAFDDPAMWTYQDEAGKWYTPKVQKYQGTVTQGDVPSTWENILIASNSNYQNPILGAPARWKESWNNNTNAIKALWDSPFVMVNPWLLGAKTVDNLAGKEGIQKTIRLYNASDNSDNAKWLWQRSLAGDLLEFAMLFPAVAEGYQLGNGAIQKGKRFIQDVGDRYKGMKDAAAYRSTNGNTDARTIANIQWWNNGGTPTGIGRMGISNSGDFGIHYPDDEIGHWFSPVIEKGGEMTLTTHLGGDIPGENIKDVLPMSKSEKMSLVKYLKGVPKYTYLGEVGKTKNYAEQYFNVKPNRMRAFKDAVLNRKEINHPYWNEEERIADFIDENDPIQKAYYRHLYNANEPLSTDSYKLMMQEAAKDDGSFILRYDSSPMGLFNPQGFYENEFYESLLPLAPEEQVSTINKWIKGYYPEARPAYLKDGEVMIPRPLLMLKGK